MNKFVYSPNFKEQLIFDTGMYLFTKHGIKRVSVEEICLKSGVSKRTFYKYFRNKVALGKAVIEVLYDNISQQINSVLESEIPLPKKLKKILTLKIKAIQTWSDEFIRFFIEAKDFPEIEELLKQKSKEKNKVAKNLYAEAILAKEIDASFSPEFLVTLGDLMGELINHPRLKPYASSSVDLGEKIGNIYLYGILGERK